jgi:hypothetical protein
MWLLFVVLPGPPKFGRKLSLKIVNDVKPLDLQILLVIRWGGKFENSFALRKVARILLANKSVVQTRFRFQSHHLKRILVILILLQ